MKKDTVNNVKINNIALISVLFLFIIIALRGAHLALSTEVDGINLSEFATKRTTANNIIRANRGSIYDANGGVLAQSVSSYKLIAYLSPKRTTDDKYPRHVVDKEKTATLLSPILGLDAKTILEYLNKENLYQTEFGSKGKNLTELTKEAIEELDLPGLDFIETSMRNYPYGDFLSYTIGYAKVNDKNELIGELGIESLYNKELSGEDGYTVYQKDRNGYKISGTKEVTVDKNDGNDIYLTIDSKIQFFVEQALDESYNNYGYKSMCLIVADAKTGAILAMSTNPSFDPNTRNITNYLDLCTQTSFEPGSTMKVYTYMAALENKVYNGNDRYMSGTFTANDGTIISDWIRAGWGELTFDQGFIHSSNIAVVNLMDKYMDKTTLRNYFTKLGFASKTGIELPNESKGKIEFKYETEVLNASFGQGITTTPIQHIQALSSLANNGEMVKPHIIKKIVDPNTNEIIYESEREVVGRVASTETVEYMKDLMYKVINTEEGTGYSYRIDGYDILGKTGTAQIASTDGTGYLSGDNVFRSVSLLFPKDDPEIIVYSAVKLQGGGLNPILVPVKQVVSNVSDYLKIYEKESTEAKEKLYEMDSFINKSLDTTTKLLSTKNIKYTIIGDGKTVINQYPLKGITVSEGDHVFLYTNGKFLMPNIKGYSLKDVIIMAKYLNIELEYSGYGYVISQSIPPETLINKGDKLSVELLRKNVS